MTKLDILELPWVELSRTVTQLDQGELLDLIKREEKGKARPYVMLRLYSGIRAIQYRDDCATIEEGKVPAWVKKLC